MKKLQFWAPAAVWALLVGCGTPVHNSGLTTVSIVGPPGSAVTGHYVQNGTRVELTETLPFSFAQQGISEVEVRKVELATPISLAAQYDEGVQHSEVLSEAGPGLAGLRVRIDQGLTAERVD